MAVALIYRTEGGMIMRITEADDGALSVETLKGGTWVAGRIGMVGLRLVPSTVRLTPRQIRDLPA